MTFRYLIPATLLVFALEVAHASLQDYMDLIIKNCPNSNTLLIKKSLFELKNSSKCDSRFTKELMSNCSTLTCTQLVANFKKNISGRTGSVVGE